VIQTTPLQFLLAHHHASTKPGRIAASRQDGLAGGLCSCAKTAKVFLIQKQSNQYNILAHNKSGYNLPSQSACCAKSKQQNKKEKTQ